MPGIVEFGQQQVGKARIIRYPDLLILQFVAQALDPSGGNLGVTHPTSLPDRG
jgi:hypothetical protein